MVYSFTYGFYYQIYDHASFEVVEDFDLFVYFDLNKIPAEDIDRPW